MSSLSQRLLASVSLGSSLSGLVVRLLLVSILVSSIASMLLLLIFTMLLDPRLPNASDFVDLETIISSRSPSTANFGKFHALEPNSRHFDYFETVDNFPRLKKNSSRYLERGEELKKMLPTNLLDLQNFSFLSIPGQSKKIDFAENDQPTTKLVIVIHSAPENIQQRATLRAYLKRIKSRVKLALYYTFVIGASTEENVDKETEQFADIVGAPFIDSYQNLTYKHLASLRWAIEASEKLPDFILKLDDDAFINLEAISQLLVEIKKQITEVEGKHVRNFLACSRFPGALPTPRKGKWALSKSVFPFERLPAYCSGLGYFLSPDVAFDLVEGSNRLMQYTLPVDDLFVTGLVVAAFDDEPLKLEPIALNTFYEYNVTVMRSLAEGDQTKRLLSSILIADTGADDIDSISLRERLWGYL